MAAKRSDVDAVVVMDGDGEDNPADLPRLLDTLKKLNAPIILAHRAKRSEGILFRFFYAIYKYLFRYLTGITLSFGNYCALTPDAAKRLTFMPYLWSSLPATCLKSRLPTSTIPIARAQRRAGETKMNFVSLVLHGIRATSVFSDVVLVRLSLLVAGAALICSIIVVCIRLVTSEWIVPGWASNMEGFLAVSLLIISFRLLNTSLLTMQKLSNMPMIAYLHSDMYIQEIRRIF